jgi:thioredoxin reductase (NADPH)
MMPQSPPEEASPSIKLSGTAWCPDCRRSKEFLGEHRIAYETIDIERDPEAMAFVLKANQG